MKVQAKSMFLGSVLTIAVYAGAKYFFTNTKCGQDLAKKAAKKKEEIKKQAEEIVNKAKERAEIDEIVDDLLEN